MTHDGCSRLIGSELWTAVPSNINKSFFLDDISDDADIDLNADCDLNTAAMNAARVVVSMRQQRVRNLSLVLRMKDKFARQDHSAQKYVSIEITAHCEVNHAPFIRRRFRNGRRPDAKQFRQGILGRRTKGKNRHPDDWDMARQFWAKLS
jgi:hypothetical protein